MFCGYCGKQIDDDSKFCIYCGQKTIKYQETSSEAGRESAPVSAEAVNGSAGEGFASPAQAGNTTPAAAVGSVNGEFMPPAQGYSGGAAFKPATVSGQKGARGARPAGGKVPQKNVYLVGAACLVAVIALIVAVPRAVGLIGGGESTSAETQSVQVQQGEQSSQDESATSSGGSEASKQEKESSSKADDSKKTIEVKSGIDQYSWSELASIAKEIESSAKSRDEALKMAANYNLVASDGTLTGATKTLQTSMGNVDVFIIDVFKDKDSTGKNAAFTFMTSSVFMNHPMNDTETNSGGWMSSAMRSWLDKDVLQAFPDELRSSVVAVSKKTNNVGKTRSTDSVGTTLDSVWLFSWVECLGPIAWNTGSEQSYIDDVDNQEGTQYAWFSQQGADGVQGHPSLDRALVGSDEAAVWWMRSSAPNTSTSFGDMGPEIDNGGNASTAEGVVFGFCL